MKKWKNFGIELILVSILVAIDQWTKYLAVQHVKGNGVIGFIPGILQFRYIENTGGAFSFFENRVTLFAIVTGLFLLVGTIFYINYCRKHDNVVIWYRLVFVMVLAGGLGNLIDRIILGYVVDFLEFGFINFPIFNIADIYVTLVMIFLIGYLIYDEFIKKTK